ncbi:MAG: hypothetical protein ACYC0V_21840, partial [Armatimonadota bacterium]
MRGAIKWLKHEYIELLPAVVFFLFAFNLIVLTDALTMEQYGIRVFSFLSATLLAIVIAKVVLVANLLPFMNMFRQRPLIYTTLWKTAIYVCTSLVVQYVERLIKSIPHYAGLGSANQHVINEFAQPRFWA